MQSPERDQLILDNLPLVKSVLSRLRQTHEGVQRLDPDDGESAGYVGLINAAEGFDPTRGFAFSTYAVPAIRRAILAEANLGVVRHPPQAKHRLAGRTLSGDDLAEVAPEENPLLDRELIQSSVDRLPGELQIAARLRYGFIDHREHTIQEVAERMGLTPHQARRRLAKARQRIREYLRARV